MTLRNLPSTAAFILTSILASACVADASREVCVTPNILTSGGQATVHYKGRFADKTNLALHYGFNGWNRIEGVNDFEIEDDAGNKNYYKEASMTKTSESGFWVTIDVPSGDRDLHYVFYWNDNGSKHWDNNQRRDYSKAITIPYIGPYLTWNQNTRSHNGIVINYQTSSATQTRVEYGKTPSLGTNYTKSEPRVSHHVELTGLDGHTVYYYRVYGSSGVPSPIYSFKTSSANPNTFSFAVTADMQDNGDDRRWDDVANELAANHADVAFILIVGDMPWNNQPGHWWTFFDKGRNLLASKVIMPASGNHDTPRKGSHPDISVFEQLFELPAGSGSERYYEFTFANARFLILNSEVPDGFKKDFGNQYRWVRGQLDGDDAISQWTFAYWHIPPYDTARRHYREQG